MPLLDRLQEGWHRLGAAWGPARAAWARPARTARLLALFGICLAATGCATTTARVSTQYYDISGSSPRELDREMRRRGPDNGKAVASAGISIRPVALEPASSGGLCRFRRARFSVDAAVTLPRWREETASQDARLRRNWQGFAAYARAHEAVHVRIAETFARELEKAFLAIPPQPSCTRLEAIGLELVRRAVPLHRRVQLAFDAQEKRRFAELAARSKRAERAARR